MTSNIHPFTYNAQPVRVVTIDGEPWFVLADLCKVLDLAKPSRVAMRIADDMKGAHLMSTPGGDQEMTIVSEAGMYEVIIRSDKPEAAAFRRWVTSEVLPSIRKHGGYLTDQKIEDILDNPDTIIELATKVKETTIVHSDGHVSISKTTKVTGKDQVYFVTRFLDGRLPKGINDEEAA